MKIILFLFIPFLLFSDDIYIGEQYEKNGEFEKAGDMYLQAYETDTTGLAAFNLGKLYLYKFETTKENCNKGVTYLFSSLEGKPPRLEAFLELSKLFEKGICVKQDFDKAQKYKNIYNRKVNETY